MTPSQALALLRASGTEQLRMAWCDLHGHWHAKTILPLGFDAALNGGIRMASSLMLKDTSGRTAFPVFDEAAMARLANAGSLAAFCGVGDVRLLPDLATLKFLPWAKNTAWVQCDAHSPLNGPIDIDPRAVLRQALGKLAAMGFSLRVGLEVEFHVYRFKPSGGGPMPSDAQWPGCGPLDSELSLLHCGYQLLSECHADASCEVLHILQSTCSGLGLPLRSLEIEMGPSQFEAVFDVQDGQVAADTMVLFRSAARQALARAGYFTTFVGRPPFKNAMGSGWHVHQSLWAAETRASVFDPQGTVGNRGDAFQPLSDLGMSCVAGLLANASAMAAIAVPTMGGYTRLQAKALAPVSACWGLDSRSSMLRLVGTGTEARIENRLPEPMANPYLLMAAQSYACMAGVRGALQAPPALASPYATAASLPGVPIQGHLRVDPALPSSLADAVKALDENATMRDGFGSAVVDWYLTIKRQEIARHSAALDGAAWERAEYFAQH